MILIVRDNRGKIAEADVVIHDTKDTDEIVRAARAIAKSKNRSIGNGGRVEVYKAAGRGRKTWIREVSIT